MHTLTSSRVALSVLCGLLAGLAGCAASGRSPQAEPRSAGIASTPPHTETYRSVYLGWRTFQANCARCHGPDAGGTASAPDLRLRVKGMSEERFTQTVLSRYRWLLPSAEAGVEGSARDALVREILSGPKGATEMPAWGDEPAVRGHVRDLYNYLEARAQGRQGPGRPPPQ